MASQLASRGLFDPDEGRSAETMREMAVSGDFLLPRLNGLLWLDKPFLYFASGALAMRLLGATELAARLPALASTLATALLIGAFADRLWGRRAAWLAGLAMVTAPLPLLYSQIVIFDAMLGFWISAALVALYLAVEAEPARSRIPWSHLAWAAMALGTLTKGPVALLVPLAAATPWALWRRRPSRFWRRGAPAVWLALVAPWVWIVSRRDPEFLHYVLATETWSRLTSNELQRDAPFWYYLPYLLLGALPWSLVAASGWKDLRLAWRRRDGRILFLLAWLVVPLLVFSLIHSKRPHYILPLVPSVVLLAVWTWEQRPAGARLPGVRAAALVWSGIGCALLVAGSGLVPRLAAKLEGVEGTAFSRVRLAAGGICIAAGLFAFLARRSPIGALCTLSLPPAALLLLSGALAAEIGNQRSARDLAAAIQDDQGADVEVVGVESFPPSLPFYLGRTITVASVDGRVLRSNYILHRYQQMVDREATLRSPAWLGRAISDCRSQRLFVVASHKRGDRQALQEAGRPPLDPDGRYVRYGACAPGSGGPHGEDGK